MGFLEPGWPGISVNAGARGALVGVLRCIAAVGAIAGLAVATAAGSINGASPRDWDIRGGASPDLTPAVTDLLQIPMAAGSWRYGSVPTRAMLVSGGQVTLSVNLLEATGNYDVELHWYSPQGVVKEYDLNPGLSDAQGAQNSRQVLALSIPRRPFSVIASDTLWASITYPLSIAGLDISRALYVEVWVNDWRDQTRIRGPGVKLHIDLGVVSEDQMRAPDQPPNHRLDTEDLPPRDGLLLPAEDTGVDGVGDADGDGLTRPLDLTTANLDDLAGDDYADPSGPYEEIDPRRWTRNNGTEGNRSVMPFPDTEDLNLNNELDLNEDYYEYTVDLGNGASPYVATDVYAEYANETVPHPPGVDNGWRLYRIPMDAAEGLRFGAPDLTQVRHVRVWLDGVFSPDGTEAGNPEVMRPLLVLGGMRIAGAGPGAAASSSPAVRTWPNPARERVTIALSSPDPRRVDLSIFDLAGRRVRRLSQGTFDAGVMSFTWDGRDDAGVRVPQGLYLIEARGSDFRSTTRVLLVE